MLSLFAGSDFPARSPVVAKKSYIQGIDKIFDNKELQTELAELFERYQCSVTVGLTSSEGVTIRSQDERVDAGNVGKIIPLDQTTAPIDYEGRQPPAA